MLKIWQRIRSIFEKTPSSLVAIVLLVWIIGFILRFIISFTNQIYTDYAEYRLPIAKALASGRFLYLDVYYDHMPVYPYLSAFMYWLSPKDPIIVSVFIRFPMVLFDSLVPLAILLLMKSIRQLKIGIWASMLYAINPISIIEISHSHWDGMATFFVLIGLTAIINNQVNRAGAYAGLGFTIKQFPLLILLFGALYTRNMKKILRMIVFAVLVTVFVLGIFLILCPNEFITGIFHNPIHKGGGSKNIIVGTVASVFDNLGVPNGKIVWGILFALAFLVPMWKVRPETILPFAGLTFVLLSIFVYVTHRHMLIWLLPFVLILLIKNWRAALAPIILLGYGYWIRLVKPDWYWGLPLLFAGIWLYILFYIEINEAYYIHKYQKEMKNVDKNIK